MVAILVTEGQGRTMWMLHLPNEPLVPEPSEELLRRLVFEAGPGYYDQGCGAASLEWGQLVDYGYRVFEDRPAIEFFAVRPGLLGVRCGVLDVTYVPYNPAARREPVT